VSTDNGIASDQDLYQIVARGLPIAGMPAFDQLSHDQIQSLVTVMKRFWKDRSEPGQRMEIAPRPVVTDETIDVGRELYVDSCAMCHGERGLGDGDAGEFIQDLQGHAVVPTNLAQGELKAGRDSDQIYLRVAAGIPGGESGFLMPPFDFLSPEETWALVEYLEAEILPPKN
jgi:mono/diheme cytochrome c family protein